MKLQISEGSHLQWDSVGLGMKATDRLVSQRILMRVMLAFPSPGAENLVLTSSLLSSHLAAVMLKCTPCVSVHCDITARCGQKSLSLFSVRFG